MSVFVVTWNLNKERDNYSTARAEFVKQLETYDYKRDPGLESGYFISTTSTATQIDTFLRKKIDENDRLFVSKLNIDEHQGWHAKSAWEWINARLY